MSDDIRKKSVMIGSMPHPQVGAALEALDRYPLSIPTWPQLPKRSFKEAMIPQCSGGMPGIAVDESEKRIWLQRDDGLVDKMTSFYENVLSDNRDAFALTEEYAAGLTAFLNQLKSNGAKLPVVKGQVTGPFTFGLGLNDNQGMPVWFDEQYRDIVIRGIEMKALWMAGQLGEYADKVIIFFDEPILSALGTPSYISIQDEDVISTFDGLSHALHEKGIVTGVHCCGNMDWGLLARTKIDIIAFDAYFFGDKVSLYPEQISAFLDSGGILAWGIVPTSDPEELKKIDTGILERKINQLTNLYVEKGFPEDKVRENIMLTPSCGMGSLGEEDAATVLRLLSEMTKIIAG
jgi:methionine synthase II (cobalamin-independent)